MKYNNLILISFLFLQGCAVLDFFKPSGLSIDTDIETDVIEGNKTVGTEADVAVDSKITGKTETTTNTAETITQSYHTINEGKSISDIVLYMFMAFLLGWLAMPSTRQMFRMIKKFSGHKTPTV